MPLRLKPVRMKNSLYLLIPKGISELLELSELSECTLTTGEEGRSPILKYSFHAGGTGQHESDRSVSHRRHPSKPGQAREAETD